MKTGIKFYYKDTHRAGYRVSFHEHNCYEIIYYIEATGLTVIGGAEYKIKPGSLAVIPPKVLHNERHDTDGCLAYVGLDTDCPLKAGVYDSPENMEMQKVFRLMIKELLDKPAEYEAMAQALATQLVLLLRRAGNTERASAGNNIAFSVEFIKENYSGRIHFGDLARLNHYSENYFRRVFKEKTGMSPQRFLTVTRLENVRSLLENPELTITEIAYRCGFSNSAQLSSMFRSEYGVSPKAYRKRLAEKG